MFTCDRQDEHIFFPPVAPTKRLQDSQPPRICLSCLQSAFGAAAMTELAQGLRVATATLSALTNEGRSLSSCATASLLCDVSIQAMRRLARDSRASGMLCDSVGECRQDTNTLALRAAAAFRPALLDLIVSLAGALAIKDAAPRPLCRAPIVRCTGSGRLESLSGSSIPVLGMTQLSDLPFSTSVPSTPNASVQSAGVDPTLPAFVGSVLAVCEHTLRDSRKSDVAEVTTLLADIVERSASFRHALACDADLLSALTDSLFCKRVAPQQGCRSVESFAFVLHLVFSEAAGDPGSLEQLAGLLSGTDAVGAQRDGFLPTLTATLGRFAEDSVVVTNVLGVLYFLLTHATTAQVFTANDCDQILRSAAPLLLSSSESNAALSCEVTRLTLEAQQLSHGGDAALLEWLEDYALEGLQCASDRGVFAVVCLLDGVATALDKHRVASNANELAHNMGGTERLHAFRRVASLSMPAMEQAVIGRYLPRLLLRGGLPMDDVAEFVCAVISQASNVDTAFDDGGGIPVCVEPMCFRGSVMLAKLLAEAAGEDVTSVAPEHTACLSRFFAGHLKHLQPPSSTEVDGRETSAFSLFSLTDEVTEDTFAALLVVVNFLLPVSSDLQPIALLALRDVLRGRAPAIDAGASSRRTNTARTLLGVAIHLFGGFFATAKTLTTQTTRELSALVQAGLIDSLLSYSAPAHNDEVERLRLQLVGRIACDHQATRDGWHGTGLQGVTSMREVLCHVCWRGDGMSGVTTLSSSAIHSSAFGSRMLLGMAALGGAAAASFQEFSDFIGAGLYHLAWQINVCRNSVAEADHNDRAERGSDAEEAAVALIAHIVRLYVVHLHWCGGLSETMRGGESTGGACIDTGALDIDAKYLCTAPLVRRKVADSLASLNEYCLSMGLPSVDQAVQAMLEQGQGFTLGVHLSLAAAVETIHATCQPLIMPDRLGVWKADAHVDLLLGRATVDGGECMLATVFHLIRHSARNGDCLGLGLLRFLERWLDGVAAGTDAVVVDCPKAGRNSSPHNAKKVYLCLLERYCTPLVLTWGSSDARRGGGDAVSSPTDTTVEDLACAVTNLVVVCLTHLGRAEGSGSDGVLIKWCVRGLTREYQRGGCFLQLFCLLLERSHGQEFARRFGTAPLALLNEPCLITATLTGVVRFQVFSSSFPVPEAGLWRRWHEFVPISLLARAIAEHDMQRDKTGYAMFRERLLVIRACDYIFQRCCPSTVVAAPSAALDAATAPPSVSEAEYYAGLCVLDWCTCLLLASGAGAIGCGNADEVHRCSASACHVLHFLLRGYRASMGSCSHLLSLLLLCDRGHTLLSHVVTGWVLAALLYAMPTAPWHDSLTGGAMGGGAATLARSFLASVEKSAFPQSTAQEERETRAMFQALTAACEYHTAATKDPQTFPLHRVKDFFLSHSPSSTPARPEEEVMGCFLLHNTTNVALTTP